jgi:hypothetical protein
MIMDHGKANEELKRLAKEDGIVLPATPSRRRIDARPLTHSSVRR